MRKLASIQTITKLEEIPKATSIEKAYILGWECIVKKGEFKEGDLCVYFEVDSILPPWKMFEFMEKRRYRVKIAKFMKQISCGLALPLNSFNNFIQVVDIKGVKYLEIDYDKRNKMIFK